MHHKYLRIPINNSTSLFAMQAPALLRTQSLAPYKQTTLSFGFFSNDIRCSPKFKWQSLALHSQSTNYTPLHWFVCSSITGCMKHLYSSKSIQMHHFPSLSTTLKDALWFRTLYSNHLGIIKKYLYHAYYVLCHSLLMTNVCFKWHLPIVTYILCTSF